MADDAVEEFDFGKKKSKKSKKATEHAIHELMEETAAVTLEDADLDPDAAPDMDFGKKKKKKSKEAAAHPEGEQQQQEHAAEGEGAEAFEGLKKKKKKKAAFEEQPEEAEEAPAEAEAGEEAGDEGAMDEEEGGDDIAEDEEGDEGAEGEEDDDRADAEARALLAEAEQEAWLGSDRDYTYPELLSRVFRILRENNPELMGEKRKYTIPPPNVQREGSKKTLFANIVEICQRMKRSPEHVIQFLFAELGTTGSVAGAGQLIIRGRFQQKGIENVLKRYISEYVTCKVCRSPNTRLTRGENRLYFLECDNCHSKRSVTTVKTGFQAQVGRRAAQRK